MLVTKNGGTDTILKLSLLALPESSGRAMSALVMNLSTK